MTAELSRFNAFMTLSLLGIVAAAGFVLITNAAQVSSMKNTMTNQATSGTALHTITFTLSGGNTFATGEQIRLDFPNSGAFVQSGTWTTADFSFTDGVARTVAGVNVGSGASTVSCSDGINNVGVALDTATLEFRVIPCGASFTASGAGAAITFTISGASPNGILTNPASQGSYYVTIVNAAGDCTAGGDICGMAVPIVSGPGVSITAVVGGCGNGTLDSGEECDDGNYASGDGCSSSCQQEVGSGVPNDSTPPIISNVQITALSGTTASISWNTNEHADTRVEYGPSVPYASSTFDPFLSMSHFVSLTTLTPGVTYHYRVCSTDNAANQSCSADATFTTPDAVPPSLSNVQVTGITASGATITWTTNENASTFVDYDLDGSPYAATSGAASPLTTSHSVTLTGLNHTTTYHFRARSGDAAGNEAFTADATFSTLPPSAPSISNIQVTSISATSATVTWTTSTPTTRFVDYGTVFGPPYSNTVGASSPLLTSHSVTLTGLSESTTYHFRVRSADATPLEVSSVDATFATLDVTAPAISSVTVSNITATSARITWATNESADSHVDYGTTISYGGTANDAALGTSHQITLSGLSANTLHHFRARSADASNNEGVSGDFTFTTALPAAPVISGITVSFITENSARVGWTTSTAADTTVEYGTTISYGSASSDAVLGTAHLRNLTGLTTGTTYHFRVKSVDAFGQQSISGDGTFVTLPDTIAPPNVTGLTAVADDAKITLSWTNPADPDFASVRVMRKTAGFPSGPADGVLAYAGIAEGFEDANLTNDIVYYYTVYSADEVPNYSTGAVVSETPVGPPDTTAPGPVTGFSALGGDSQITLAWTNPTDPDYTGTRILRKSGGCPANRNDGTVVHDGTGTSRIDTGLTNGTSYCYAAFTYDLIPNFSGAVTASATPEEEEDLVPPGAVTNFTATPGDALVLLSWNNPNDPDWSGTRIVRKTGSQPTSAWDGTVLVEAAVDSFVDDVNVTNDVTYFYAAFAFDADGNFAPGAFASATPREDLPPPVLACTDSDGGRIYETAGTVSTTDAVFSDVCIDAATLTEQFCADLAMSSEQHACGAGQTCVGGRCVTEPYEPLPDTCGNSFCDGRETSLSCPGDCPAMIGIPFEDLGPTNVPPEERIQLEQVKFYATEKQIELRFGPNNEIEIYPATAVRVYLPDSAIRKEIQQAYVTLEGTSYAMRETHSYEATLQMPDEVREHPLTFSVLYQDGTHEITEYSFVVNPFNIIYEVVDGNPVPVMGARVAVFQEDETGRFGLWNGPRYGQENPIITNVAGSYGYIAEPGIYRIQVEAQGFRPFTTLPFRVRQNLVGRNVELVRLPPPLIEDPVENIRQQTEFVVESVRQEFLEFTDNEFVEEGTRDIVAPVAVITAVANVATAGTVAATALPYIYYLYSLLTHPALLIARRRRKQWGIVYNAFTRLPIDLAIVRLTDTKTSRIVRSAVTDKDGRYFFIVGPGEYTMTVVKAGYVFPSESLKGEKEDVHLVDLYHGEKIITTEGATITANIPVDPTGEVKTPAMIRAEVYGRDAQKGIGIIAILAMLAVVIIIPSALSALMLVVNIVMYILFRRLAVPPRPKNWGIVYDETTGRPLQNAVARIFDTRFNKLLESQITDIRGRYAFLVGQNTYYVTYEKAGYAKESRGPVDLMKPDEKGKKQEAQVVAMDVRLKKET